MKTKKKKERMVISEDIYLELLKNIGLKEFVNSAVEERVFNHESNETEIFIKPTAWRRIKQEVSKVKTKVGKSKKVKKQNWSADE